jgi:hypothetical protein
MNLGNFPKTPGGAGVPQSNRRSEPRYTFTATTEIEDPARSVKISGRVSEISRKGCYVDSLNTMPKGTILNLKILRDQGTFAARGEIIYVLDRFGMGIKFLDPPADQMIILDSWLADLPPVATG